MGDEFGISTALHSVVTLLAGAAVLGGTLCAGLIIGSILVTARGRAKRWEA